MGVGCNTPFPVVIPDPTGLMDIINTEWQGIKEHSQSNLTALDAILTNFIFVNEVAI